MGTGAVYVTLFSLKDRAEFLEAVETGLYFLNVIIFMLNSTTLLLQAIRKCIIWPEAGFWGLALSSLSTESSKTSDWSIYGDFCPCHCVYTIHSTVAFLIIVDRFSRLRRSLSEPLIMLYQLDLSAAGSSTCSFGLSAFSRFDKF